MTVMGNVIIVFNVKFDDSNRLWFVLFATLGTARYPSEETNTYQGDEAASTHVLLDRYRHFVGIIQRFFVSF